MVPLNLAVAAFWFLKEAGGPLPACVLVLALPAPVPVRAQPAVRNSPPATNDEHSEVIPADTLDFPAHPTTGGLSRIAHEIVRIKAEKAAVGEPVVVTNSGDFSQGTFFAWLETMAAAELSLMQGIGYEVVALGNHEFEMGAGYRAQALQSAAAKGVTLPVLCSNITFNDADPQAAALHSLWSDDDLGGTALAIQPYTVKDLPNGLRLGFFSLMGVEAEVVAPMAKATGVEFGNVYDGAVLDQEASFLRRVFKAQDMTNQLRLKGCDVVICLSHMGTSEELQLCNFVSGLDVILGGHSHSLNYPPIIRNGIIVVQSGAYSKYLGELELSHDEGTGKVSVRSGRAIHMDEGVPSVPSVDAWIDNYITAINAFIGEDVMAPFAETDYFGDGGFNINEGPPFTETNLGDLVTDSYVAAGSAVSPDRVQLGIEANGVIRSGILQGGEGVFNAYDLFRALPLGATPDTSQAIPFGYPLCAFYLFGGEILGALDATLGMGDNQFFLQMSGGSYAWRPAGEAGGRVASLLVDDGTGNYEPIDPGGLYKVATNFYTASFLAMFGLAPRTKTGAPTDLMSSRIMAGPNEVKAWQALFSYVGAMPDTDGDGIPNIPNPRTVGIVPLPQYQFPQGRITTVDWNMAEGASAGGMETFVLVQNPGLTDVQVNVVFLTGTGQAAPPELQGVKIPAQSRVTQPTTSGHIRRPTR